MAGLRILIYFVRRSDPDPILTKKVEAAKQISEIILYNF
jgi:hypothetical protein